MSGNMMVEWDTAEATSPHACAGQEGECSVCFNEFSRHNSVHDALLSRFVVPTLPSRCAVRRCSEGARIELDAMYVQSGPFWLFPWPCSACMGTQPLTADL